MAHEKVLFFGDFGVDDMLAVIYSYFSEEIEIVGYVADYGNVSKTDAVRNVLFFQNLTGISDIPVFGGAEIPLTGQKPIYYPEIHGPVGLGPIIPEFYPENVLENFFEITEIIHKFGNKLIIYSAGRLTSLATMFILYPEIMKKVKDIYIMGGAFQTPGNATAMAEANIYSDPFAANIVLELSAKKIHLIPLDVTRNAILTPEMVNQLNEHFIKTNNKVGKIIKPMVDYYYKYYKMMQPSIKGSPIHDLLALWAISEKSKVNYVDIPVRISIEKGECYGQSMGDLRQSTIKAPWPVHHVANSFDYQLFIKQIFRAFKSEPKQRC
jgi:purine nucleosidase